MQQGQHAETSNTLAEEPGVSSDASGKKFIPALTDAHEANTTMYHNLTFGPMGGPANQIDDDPVAVTTTPMIDLDWDTSYLTSGWYRDDMPVLTQQQQLQSPSCTSNLTLYNATNYTNPRQINYVAASTSDASLYSHDGAPGFVRQLGIVNTKPPGWCNYSMPSSTQYSSSPNELLYLAPNDPIEDTAPVNHCQPDETSNGFNSGLTTFGWDPSFELSMANTFTELNEPIKLASFTNRIPIEVPDIHANLATLGIQPVNDGGAFLPGYARCTGYSGGCVSWNPCNPGA